MDNVPTNPKPQILKQHSGRVFDVVRPGKVLASPTSRPTIDEHKPVVQDDQFVPHASKLDTKPLLQHHDSAIGLSPDTTSDEAKPISSLSQPAPIVGDDGSMLSVGTQDVLESKPSEDVTTPVDSLTNVSDEAKSVEEPSPEPLVNDSSIEVEKTEEQLPSELVKPSPEQLAVGQAVSLDISDDKLTALPDHVLDDAMVNSPMVSDDLLTTTGSPSVSQAIVSDHKSISWLQWSVVILLFIIFIAITLDILLGLGVIKTNLNIPYTNLITK